MSLLFTCPHCGVKTNVPDEFAGQTGPCGECQQSITIPSITERPDSPAPAKRSHARLIVLLGVLALCVVAASWLFKVGPFAAPLHRPSVVPPVVTSPWKPEPLHTDCSVNLRRIGEAMSLYHNVHGTFPPAYLADDEGRPTHSWRALLLPYLDDPWVGVQYSFDEPWDGPNNKNLLSSRPDVFCCSSDSATGESDTSYLMIVGPDTISDGAGSHSLEEITDPQSSVILVVEVSHSGVAWSEPVDLDADAITYSLNDGSPQGIRGGHEGGAHVLRCDGSVQFMKNDLKAKTMKAWSTVAGAETF